MATWPTKDTLLVERKTLKLTTSQRCSSLRYKCGASGRKIPFLILCTNILLLSNVINSLQSVRVIAASEGDELHSDAAMPGEPWEPGQVNVTEIWLFSWRWWWFLHSLDKAENSCTTSVKFAFEKIRGKLKTHCKSIAHKEREKPIKSKTPLFTNVFRF